MKHRSLLTDSRRWWISPMLDCRSRWNSW